jgi:hypothetical protein
VADDEKVEVAGKEKLSDSDSELLEEAERVMLLLNAG